MNPHPIWDHVHKCLRSKYGCNTPEAHRRMEGVLLEPSLARPDVPEELREWLVQRVAHLPEDDATHFCRSQLTPLLADPEIDVLGELTEYFLGRGKGVMGDDGIFYTHRAICRLLAERVQRVRGEAPVRSMLDRFCGTGGFAWAAAKTWGPATALYLADVDPHSVARARWNLWRIGVRPAETAVGDMFRVHAFPALRCDVLLTNPPFGHDLKKAHQRTHLDIGPHLRDLAPLEQDKVTLAWYDAWQSLADGGVAGMVIPDGWLSARRLQAVRRFFAERVEILEILEFDRTLFPNTWVKTSAVIWRKQAPGPGHTAAVYVARAPDWQLQPRTRATQAQLCSRAWQSGALDGPTYARASVPASTIGSLAEPEAWSALWQRIASRPPPALPEVPRLFRGWQAFPEMVLCQRGTPLTQSQYQPGTVPVVGAGLVPSGRHAVANRPPDTLLCSQSGAYAGHISRYPVPVWASDSFSLQPRDPALSGEWLYSCLRVLQQELYDSSRGTAQPHVYPSMLQEWRLPLPTDDVQAYLDYLRDVRDLALQLQWYETHLRRALEEQLVAAMQQHRAEV